MVCVLMSTYNGAKYLDKQIESLIKQRYAISCILIRDDGSSDETLSLIKDYEQKYDMIKLITGKNVGSTRSFLELINIAPSFDYYAFCDQDDIWDDDKLQIAIDNLEKLPSNVPNMYFSNARLVNAQGEYLYVWHKQKFAKQNKFAALLENKATGATMVFNKVALEYVKDRCYDGVKHHDWWMYLITKFFGNVIYDERPHINYRQHDGNVVGARKKPFLYRLVHFIKDNSCPRLKNSRAFYREYVELLKKDDSYKIRKLITYQKSLCSKFRILTDSDFFDDVIDINIKDRLLIIFNKL